MNFEPFAIKKIVIVPRKHGWEAKYNYYGFLMVEKIAMAPESRNEQRLN